MQISFRGVDICFPFEAVSYQDLYVQCISPFLSIRLRISFSYTSTNIMIGAVYLKKILHFFILNCVDTTKIKTGRKIIFLNKVLIERLF